MLPFALAHHHRRRFLLGASASAALVLTGCGTRPQIADYASEKPVFDLKAYFNGVVDGWGIFTDRSGKVVRRFIVTMNKAMRASSMKTLCSAMAKKKSASGA